MKLKPRFGQWAVKPSTDVMTIEAAVKPYLTKAAADKLQVIVIPLDSQFLGLSHFCEDVGLDAGDLTMLFNTMYAAGWAITTIVPVNYTAGVANGIERAHHAVFTRLDSAANAQSDS